MCNFVSFWKVDGGTKRISSRLVEDSRRQPSYCRSGPRTHEPWIILSTVLAPHVTHTVIVSSSIAVAPHQIWNTKHVTHFMTDNTNSSHALSIVAKVGRCAGIQFDSHQPVFRMPRISRSDGGAMRPNAMWSKLLVCESIGSTDLCGVAAVYDEYCVQSPVLQKRKQVM